MKSILIVKTSSIGDVIHTFGVLGYLRERFPRARIDWVVEKSCADLLRAHPLVDTALVVDTRAWRRTPFSKQTREEVSAFSNLLRTEEYDLLIDLQGNSKSALITLLAKAKDKVGFDWKSLPEKPNWFVLNKRYPALKNAGVRLRYLNLVQSYFQDPKSFAESPHLLKISEGEDLRLKEILSKPALSHSKKLMVAFGSKWKNKQLSEETLFEFVSKIAQEPALSLIFIWGSKEEKEVADKLAAAFPEKSTSVGELSLNLWQALMNEMTGVIAMDSAALHLCGTSLAPSFSVFGASSSSYYKPEGDKHGAYQGACPYGRTFEKRCPILRTCSTGACIRSLSAEPLYRAFLSWWTAHEESMKDEL